MPTMAELGEWGLIAALKARYGQTGAGWVGIGDDAAVTRAIPGLLMLTTVDLLVEGVHFRRETTTPEDLGWKSLAVNLSDIAAMGGIPRWLVLGLSAPGQLDSDWVLRYYDGLAKLARSHDTLIAGGDTVGSSDGVTISITVIGQTERPLLRSSAEAGDWVFVTGPIGASAAGLWTLEHPEKAAGLDPAVLARVQTAHRRPIPQLDAGRKIAGTFKRVALLDDSDGLARSARLIAEASGVDLRLESARFPIDEATRTVAALAGRDPIGWALHGGEDYQLIGTVAPNDWGALEDALTSVRAPLHRVGEVLQGTGHVWVERPDGHVERLGSAVGFNHFDRRSEA